MKVYLVDYDRVTIEEVSIDDVTDNIRWRIFESFDKAKQILKCKLKYRFASAKTEYNDSLEKLLKFGGVLLNKVENE